MADQQQHYRKDDSVLRKSVIAVVIALAVQAVSVIYFMGQLTNQVSNNTRAIQELAKGQEIQHGSIASIARLDATVSLMVSRMDRLADKLDFVADEQKARTSRVYGDNGRRHE